MRQSIQTFRGREALIATFAVAMIVVLYWIDVRSGVLISAAPIYPVLLLICLARRNRVVLWLVTVVALIANFSAYYGEHGDLRSMIHRLMAAGALLGAAVVFDIFIAARRSLEQRES